MCLSTELSLYLDACVRLITCFMDDILTVMPAVVYQYHDRMQCLASKCCHNPSWFCSSPEINPVSDFPFSFNFPAHPLFCLLLFFLPTHHPSPYCSTSLQTDEIACLNQRRYFLHIINSHLHRARGTADSQLALPFKVFLLLLTPGSTSSMSGVHSYNLL